MLQTLFIDFETYLINNDNPIPEPICLSYYDGKVDDILIGEEIGSFLTKIFQDKHINIGAHNASFELNVITKYYPHLKPHLYKKLRDKQIICTKVYEQLLDCTRKKSISNFSLASLVLKYFNLNISENKKNKNSWRYRYHELVNVPLIDWPEEAIKYSKEDSILAYKIYLKQREEKEIDTSISVAADYYLNRMGLTGINIDQDRVTKVEEELKEKIKDYVKRLEEASILVHDKKGRKRNMKYFKEVIKEKIPHVRTTAKGAVSTSREDIMYYLTLITEEDPFHSILVSYAEVMKAEKVLTAFVARLKKASPCIRTQYNAVVSSGRTSSFTSENFPSVNIQQMPREVKGLTWDVRNCFVPREGYKIFSIDYSGLELASAASQLYKITGQRDMLDILNQGDDPVDMHSMLAYRFMNMKEKTNETYESFVQHKKEPLYKKYRQLAKPINLGFPGGIGYDTMRTLLARDGIYPKLKVLNTSRYEEQLQRIASGLRKKRFPVRVRQVARHSFELIYDELVALKDELFNLYPDLKHFLTEGHRQFLTGESKRMKNEFGEWEQEEMYSYQIEDFERNWCTYTQLCNGILMQSPSAIGAKRAVIRVMEEFADTNVIISQAFIHDEIVGEVKECPQMYDLIQDLAKIMLEEMGSTLTESRRAVEAEFMNCWRKSGGEWSRVYWMEPHTTKIKFK
jgi:DNA polymerase I-like protein with 3'-5' exonuclease and polymerase domains